MNTRTVAAMAYARTEASVLLDFVLQCGSHGIPAMGLSFTQRCSRLRESERRSAFPSNSGLALKTSSHIRIERARARLKKYSKSFNAKCIKIDSSTVQQFSHGVDADFALELLLASGTRMAFRFNRDVALFARRFRSRSWRLYRLNEFPLAFGRVHP